MCPHLRPCESWDEGRQSAETGRRPAETGSTSLKRLSGKSCRCGAAFVVCQRRRQSRPFGGTNPGHGARAKRHDARALSCPHSGSLGCRRECFTLPQKLTDGSASGPWPFDARLAAGPSFPRTSFSPVLVHQHRVAVRVHDHEACRSGLLGLDHLLGPVTCGFNPASDLADIDE